MPLLLVHTFYSGLQHKLGFVEDGEGYYAHTDVDLKKIEFI